MVSKFGYDSVTLPVLFSICFSLSVEIIFALIMYKSFIMISAQKVVQLPTLKKFTTVKVSCGDHSMLVKIALCHEKI